MLSVNGMAHESRRVAILLRCDARNLCMQLTAKFYFEIGEPAIHLDALDRYRSSKLHFVDCLIAAAAAAAKIPVAIFDHGFRKFPDVRVETD